MTEEEIRGVASAVKALIDQDKEKEKVGQQLNGVRKEIGELKGEFGKVQQGMFCDPSGKYCFFTPEELSSFMKEQKEKLNGVESKIAEVATQVKELKPVPSTTPEGLKRLPKMDAEKRKAMTEEDNQARDLQIKKVGDYYGETDNDRWRQLEKVEANLDGVAKKQSVRKRVLDNLSDEERKKVVLYGCKNGKCKVWRENMEGEEGIKFYLKDERGRFKPVDEPEKEESHF